MLPRLPSFKKVRENKNSLREEYQNYLKILSTKNINLRAEKIFHLYKPLYFPLGYDNLVKNLFTSEKEGFDDPDDRGFQIIQNTDFLKYIMKVRDILGIEYKCQNCFVRPVCCDYDNWMGSQMYKQCDGVEILSDKFACFIARKYIIAGY